MGSLFSSPSPPPVYTPPPATDPEAEAREARLEALARRRRGRAGTVATTERGLLTTSGEGGGKSLLGQ